MSEKLSKRVSGKNNPMYGKQRTIEQKEKQSVRMKGLQNSKADKNIYVFQNENDIFVGTRYDFYTSKGLNKDSVTNLLSGRYKTTAGWKYLGSNEMVQANAATAELISNQQKLLR